ncbi:hypothetical protein E3N88_45266 [Mikania micrantha]|uniref:NAC domain-containing protein n=1 Tax=Mikania micrantha TaxID=192012 RepID=A0A5N6L9N8_9ASTR|nr:hypothetical protein E3N88_45266 [Mikania micrantha]
MNNFSHVPPGFRFHPTDEELVDYYLRKKIASKRIDLDIIKDVDLYRIEPWDLQGASVHLAPKLEVPENLHSKTINLCKLGTEEQNDWYFFSYKDKKYPTGNRTNRATKAGFWKATGRDKGVYSKQNLVGMRKTLVFYEGRAPNGQKSDWIMHEVFKKRITTVQRRMDEQDSLSWFDDQVSFMPKFESPRRIIHPYTSSSSYHHQLPPKSELNQLQYNLLQDQSLFQLPQLESHPRIQHHPAASFHTTTQQLNINLLYGNNDEQDLQVTDWRLLDKFVASQLSNDQEPCNLLPSSPHMAEHIHLLRSESKSDEMASECASVSTSTCQVDLWK